jgi:chromosomal replication initiator protein
LGPLFTQKREDACLSSSYTFESFVVGISNQLAHTAALSIVRQPGTLHNPLFLHAGVGLGKTHLMHAIGNAIKAENGEASVRYCPAEKFTNELIEAIQSGRTVSQFRRRFRSVDLLLIDDIQFLAGREATQEEFFNTFNELYLAGKQIVLTSDRHPQEIKSLEARLVSRFSGGMVADIQSPDLDLRMAILKKKLEKEGTGVKEEALLSLAEQFAGSIRQLEGALTQMLFLIQAHREANPEKLVPLIIEDNRRLQRLQSPDSSKIIRETCKQFSVTKEELISTKRTKELVIPRQAAMYLLRETSTLSLTKIGEILGGKDHSTILYGIKIAKEKAKTDPLFQRQLQSIRGAL